MKKEDDNAGKGSRMREDGETESKESYADCDYSGKGGGEGLEQVIMKKIR